MKPLLQFRSGLFSGCKLSLLLVVTIHFLSGDAPAAEIPLDSFGNQFYSKPLEVGWKLPADQLPATARTFKVVPFKFSQAIVSNLTSWGGFAETDRVWKSDDGSRIGPSIFVYRKNADRQSLAIDPTLGSAFLYHPLLSWVNPEGVPDQPRAYFLATNILRQLGISTNELILEHGRPRAWFYPGELTSRGVTRPNHMGVEFRRQRDGLWCILQDIHIDFESQEQITQLEINWRGLKPSRPFPVATPQQMVAWIKEGRARVQSLDGPTGARWIHAADIKRITIIGAAAHYTNPTRFVDGEEEEIGRLYPFAVLQADAELSPDDHETIWLSCPLLATDLNRPLQAATNDIGFSVYPSQLRQRQKIQADAH